MSAEDNLKRYSNNFSKSRAVICGKEYTVYNVNFTSIYDLYRFLKSDPDINERIFRKQASLSLDTHFHGVSYSKYLEYLISCQDESYDQFLSLQSEFESASAVYVNNFIRESSYAGSVVNIPKLASLNPECFYNIRRVSENKFITLYVALSYRCGTNSRQVWNRAVTIMNIVKALEEQGFSVSVEAFEMSMEGNEVFYTTVNMKDDDSELDRLGLYKSLCRVEFLRRILFRVLETTPVRNDWGDGYGRTCPEWFVKEFLNLTEDDIYFGEPEELNVEGYSLSDDFDATIQHLKLEDKIDEEKIGSIREDVKVLSKNRF